MNKLIQVFVVIMFLALVVVPFSYSMIKIIKEDNRYSSLKGKCLEEKAKEYCENHNKDFIVIFLEKFKCIDIETRKEEIIPFLGSEIDYCNELASNEVWRK